jgi:hypothetical protein
VPLRGFVESQGVSSGDGDSEAVFVVEQPQEGEEGFGFVVGEVAAAVEEDGKEGDYLYLVVVEGGVPVVVEHGAQFLVGLDDEGGRHVLVPSVSAE